MQTFNSGGKDHPAEKVVRYIIPIGLALAGLYFFNGFIAPFFIKTFNNIVSLVGSMWAAGLALVASVIVIHFLSKQWDLFTMMYKNFCRKFTSFFVKIDFLSYLDSYIETLIEKRHNLQKTKTSLEKKKLKLERMIIDLTKNIDENMKKASAAKKVNQMEQSGLFASMAASDKESVQLYKPIYERMDKNLKFLAKLDEHFGISITKLKHEVKRKRTEFETVCDMYKGLNEAEMLASKDNNKARIFQVGLEELENQVTQKIAAITDFEKRSKSVMDGIDLEKQMLNDEGLQMLEEYETNGSLFTEISSTTVDGGDAQVISTSTIKTSDFSKLLRK